MPPEIKIILYILFIISLFIIHNVSTYIIFLIVILILLVRIPFKSLKSGWLPISLFIFFTFISNVLFQGGKILYHIGPFAITDDGLNIASMRTMRLFFMIAGAKILTATTEIDLLVKAFGNILKPLERLGIPVVEFFTTMGLTMKSLPRLKAELAEMYREKVKEENIQGFWNRSKAISTFLLTLIVKSLQSPEIFFEDDKKVKEND